MTKYMSRVTSGQPARTSRRVCAAWGDCILGPGLYFETNRRVLLTDLCPTVARPVHGTPIAQKTGTQDDQSTEPIPLKGRVLNV